MSAARIPAEHEARLQITCPFDGQVWRFHTQEQADRFQRHLEVHLPQEGDSMKEADGTPIVERWAKLYAKTNNSCSAHIDTGTYKSTAELRMLIEELSLAELRTCRGVWRCFHCDEVFDTPGGLEIAMAERDELKDTVARLAAPVRDAELTPHLLGKKWPIAEAFDALIAARTVPPAQKEQP